MKSFIKPDGKRVVRMKRAEYDALMQDGGVLPPQFDDPSYNQRTPSLAKAGTIREDRETGKTVAQINPSYAELTPYQAFATGFGNARDIQQVMAPSDQKYNIAGDLARTLGIYAGSVALTPFTGGASLGAALAAGAGTGAIAGGLSGAVREGFGQYSEGNFDAAELVKQSAIESATGAAGMGVGGAAGAGVIGRLAGGVAPKLVPAGARFAGGLTDAVVGGVTEAGVESALTGQEFTPENAALDVGLYLGGLGLGRAARGLRRQKLPNAFDTADTTASILGEAAEAGPEAAPPLGLPAPPFQQPGTSADLNPHARRDPVPTPDVIYGEAPRELVGPGNFDSGLYTNPFTPESQAAAGDVLRQQALFNGAREATPYQPGPLEGGLNTNTSDPTAEAVAADIMRRMAYERTGLGLEPMAPPPAVPRTPQVESLGGGASQYYPSPQGTPQQRVPQMPVLPGPQPTRSGLEPLAPPEVKAPEVPKAQNRQEGVQLPPREEISPERGVDTPERKQTLREAHSEQNLPEVKVGRRFYPDDARGVPNRSESPRYTVTVGDGEVDVTYTQVEDLGKVWHPVDAEFRDSPGAGGVGTLLPDVSAYTRKELVEKLRRGEGMEYARNAETPLPEVPTPTPEPKPAPRAGRRVSKTSERPKAEAPKKPAAKPKKSYRRNKKNQPILEDDAKSAFDELHPPTGLKSQLDGKDAPESVTKILPDAVARDGQRMVDLDELDTGFKQSGRPSLAEAENFERNRATYNKEVKKLEKEIRETGDVPEVVVVRKGKKYEVVEGKAVAEAARRAGHDSVPAKLYVEKSVLDDIDAPITTTKRKVNTEDAGPDAEGKKKRSVKDAVIEEISNERGAALRPSVIGEEIVKSVGKAYKKVSENLSKLRGSYSELQRNHYEFIKYRDAASKDITGKMKEAADLQKQYRKKKDPKLLEKIKETEAAIEDAKNGLRERLDVFMQEQGVKWDDIANVRSAREKGESLERDARDTANPSEFDGLKAKELKEKAREMGVSPRGSKTQLRQRLAYAKRFAELSKDSKYKLTPEERMSRAAAVGNDFTNFQRQLAERGDSKHTREATYRALFDQRGTVRKRLRDIDKDEGNRVANLLEDGTHTDAQTRVQTASIMDVFHASDTDLSLAATKNKLKNKTKVTAKELYGIDLDPNGPLKNKKQTVDDWMNDLMVAMALRSADLANPKTIHPNLRDAGFYEDYINAIRQSDFGNNQYERALTAFEMLQEATLNTQLREGAITEKDYKKYAKRGQYLPREFAREDTTAGAFQNLFEVLSRDADGRTDRGSARGINMNVEELISGTLSRSNKLLAANRANRALADMITANKEASEKLGLSVSDTDSSGDKFWFYDDDGNKKFIITTDKGFAKGWKLERGHIVLNDSTANMVQLATGVSALKATTTGFMNPLFAIRNLPRDFFHIMQTAPEYSWALPHASGQLLTDMAATFKDAMSGRDRPTGALKAYFEEGGGGETLASERSYRRGRYIKRRGKHLLTEDASLYERIRYGAGEKTSDFSGKLEAMAETMEALNNFTENWMRLAHRHRAIKNGKSPKEATHIARNRIDYSQGGMLVNDLGNFFAYLNPIMQGVRTTGRAFKVDPVRASAMAGQIAALGYASYAMWNGTEENRDAYHKIHPSERANNMVFVIPGFERIDPDSGQEENLILRIAKDDGFMKGSWFMGEQLARFQAGEDFEEQAGWDLVKAFWGVDSVMGLFPVIGAGSAYVANHDIFRNDEVWKGGDVGKKRFGPDDYSEEYDEGTNEFYKDTVGKVGLSPKRSQRAIGKVINGTNPIFRGFGALYEAATQMKQDMTESEWEETRQDMVDMMSGFFGKTLKYTSGSSELYELDASEKRKESIKSLEKRRLKKEAVDMMVNPEPELESLNDLKTRIIEKVDPEDRKEFLKDVQEEAKVRTASPLFRRVHGEILKNTSPKLQAVQFVEILTGGTKEESQAAQIVMRVEGMTPEFEKAIAALSEVPEVMKALEAMREGKTTKLNRSKLLEAISPEPE